MNQGKKDPSCNDGAPIRSNCKPRADLPLPLRELADLLAELALRQLNEAQPHEKGEEN